MKNVMRSGWLMAVALLLSTGTAMGQTPVAALAEMARTPAEHAQVAKTYRLQADALQSQADELEAHALDVAKHEGPMPVKWPGLASREFQQTRQHAVEARRAARQNRELAEFHLRLSIEAIAN